MCIRNTYTNNLYICCLPFSHLYFGDSDENEYSKNNANDRNGEFLFFILTS